MNFEDYLNRQKAEDRRAFLVHYGAKSGKTAFALRVAISRKDIGYVDLQARALEYPELFKKFDFDELKDYLLTLDETESVILVDNGDFLMNTWGKRDQKQFENWLKVLLRSPATTEKTFVFFVQSDSFVKNLVLTNSFGESRVLPLNNFDSL